MRFNHSDFLWTMMKISPIIVPFSHGHRRKAGRELQTALDRIMEEENNGPLAKNQPEPVIGP